jgi:hypothetical protein
VALALEGSKGVMSETTPARLPLSKTHVLSSNRCTRKLWWELNRGTAVEPPSPSVARRLRCAARVTEVARPCLPGGVLIDGPSADRAAQTAEVIRSGHYSLFDAAFVYGDVGVSVDVLPPSGAYWLGADTGEVHDGGEGGAPALLGASGVRPLPLRARRLADRADVPEPRPPGP